MFLLEFFLEETHRHSFYDDRVADRLRNLQSSTYAGQDIAMSIFCKRVWLPGSN
jgi:hypothetical protein